MTMHQTDSYSFISKKVDKTQLYNRAKIKSAGNRLIAVIAVINAEYINHD